MPTVKLSTSHGDIHLALDAAKAPQTVANFLAYVKSGHFAGTLFHRVIPGFMIQGGGFAAGMQQKATEKPIQNEARNGLKNMRGSIAMARTNDPHSASSQFFINLKDNDFLNHTAPAGQGWGYCVFGQVSTGMEVVDAIAKVQRRRVGHHDDVPVQDVLINAAELLAE